MPREIRGFRTSGGYIRATRSSRRSSASDRAGRDRALRAAQREQSALRDLERLEADLLARDSLMGFGDPYLKRPAKRFIQYNGHNLQIPSCVNVDNKTFMKMLLRGIPFSKGMSIESSARRLYTLNSPTSAKFLIGMLKAHSIKFDYLRHITKIRKEKKKLKRIELWHG